MTFSTKYFVSELTLNSFNKILPPLKKASGLNNYKVEVVTPGYVPNYMEYCYSLILKGFLIAVIRSPFLSPVRESSRVPTLNR